MQRPERTTNHRYQRQVVAASATLVLVVASVTLEYVVQPNTSLIQSRPVTRYIAANDGATQHIVKGVFVLDLPADWQSAADPHSLYGVSSWQGTTESDAARRLDIYVDSLPPSLAINRLLPVEVGAHQLIPDSSVSPNCLFLSQSPVQSKATGMAPVQWNDVQFTCDVGNYERDVVAAGSTEHGVDLRLTGQRTGAHQVVLVYTDNSATPDYNLFMTAVKSFHLL